MGIGSLARYRRYVLVLGGLLFLGGALMRWHSERQLRSLQNLSAPTGISEVSWSDECRSFACRIIAADGKECESICDEAVVAGNPGVPAERMANACVNHCVAEQPDDASCPSQCLIREAMRSAGERARPGLK